MTSPQTVGDYHYSVTRGLCTDFYGAFQGGTALRILFGLPRFSSIGSPAPWRIGEKMNWVCNSYAILVKGAI